MAKLTSKVIPPNEWIIDSGASRHMTANRKLSTNFTLQVSWVTIANGVKIKSPGKGDVAVELEDKKFKLTEVLYVPELDANFLSISALQARGMIVRFGLSCVEILWRGTCLATGFLVGNTYLLRSVGSGVALIATEDPEEEIPITSDPNISERSSGNQNLPRMPETAKDNKKAISTRSQLEGDPYLLWHGRMGHVGAYRLTALHEATNGVGAKLHDHEKECKCITCTQTKMTRIINRNPPERATRRLERVYSDFWGPYRVPNNQGTKYFVSFTDEATGYSDVYLGARSELEKLFRMFRNRAAVYHLLSQNG